MQHTALPTLLYVGLTVLLVAIFSQECAARSPSQLHLCRVASSARYLQFCKCFRGPGSRWTPDGFASSSESRKSCENNAKAVRYIRRSRLWHGKVLTTKMYKCKFNHEHGILLLLVVLQTVKLDTAHVFATQFSLSLKAKGAPS